MLLSTLGGLEFVSASLRGGSVGLFLVSFFFSPTLQSQQPQSIFRRRGAHTRAHRWQDMNPSSRPPQITFACHEHLTSGASAKEVFDLSP